MLGFINDRQSKTVKEKEFVGDYAALNLHKDLLLARAKVRSLEDRLRVALWLDQRQELNQED